MLTKAQLASRKKLVIMAVLVLLAAAAYMVVDVNFSNARLFQYSMRIRAPKLIVMLITAFAIGGASMVFQSIINNTIVTPCLLGMNSLYTLIHTAVVFCVGSTSIIASNANAAFAVDLVLMGITATIIYSYLFKKTNHNILYVLLIGTVLTSFFSSIQSTMTRVMDPNEYDTLLATLVASFSNINTEIIIFSLVVLAAVIFFLRKELALLDEPTNNLDIYHATNMMKIVRRLCDELGKTVILVLHEINYAAFYSDYICAFVDGKIAKFGTVKEVMNKATLSQIYNVDFEILEIEGKPLSIYY